ncbi:hypothetical protein M426DRAFT_129567 [Hypoxylon sp. CI-4A]|nr:hypothetical protein M426DRAFT_129567 [Hypoxylon sp. CI-4A]
MALIPLTPHIKFIYIALDCTLSLSCLAFFHACIVRTCFYAMLCYDTLPSQHTSYIYTIVKH